MRRDFRADRSGRTEGRVIFLPPNPPALPALLIESGFFLLLEDGSKILL